MALQQCEQNAKLCQVFAFSKDFVQRLYSQSMHYLQGYFALYEPTAALMDSPVLYGLLLTSVLGFAMKVSTQDYVLEHLPIREQLALFGITVPSPSRTEVTAHRTNFHEATANVLNQQRQQQLNSSKVHQQPASLMTSAQPSTSNSMSYESQPGLHETVKPTQAPFSEYDQILDQRHLGSEADLFNAKFQLEERLKFALGYEFTFESPIDYVSRFFQNSFAPSELQAGAGPIAHWQNFTERFIRNTTIFPMSQHYHPVYIAAGYLSFSRRYLLAEAGPVAEGDKPILPETIAGHPWFLYVDPMIELAQIESIAQVLQEEWEFFTNHMAQQAQQQQQVSDMQAQKQANAEAQVQETTTDPAAAQPSDHAMSRSTVY